MSELIEQEDKRLVTPLVDRWTWRAAYEKGYRKPRFPVPAIVLHLPPYPRYVVKECPCCVWHNPCIIDLLKQ